MLISGIQKFTLLDYPDKVSCIIFTPGCNYRCGYCHNPEFVLPEKLAEMKKDFIPEHAFWNFLESRKGKLDGVVISGGEPTMQGDLVPFIRKLKAAGFLVKLDTNGNRPDLIKTLLEEKIVDYIAMDIKTDLDHYQSVGGFLSRPEHIRQSVELLKTSSIEYEFRSTLVRELHSYAILRNMAQLVAGARHWYLQTFRPEHTLDPAFSALQPFTNLEMAGFVNELSGSVSHLAIRS